MIVHAAEHRGFYEEATVQVGGAPATRCQASAFRAPLGQVGFDALTLTRRRQWAHLGRRIEGIAHSGLAVWRRQRLYERVVPIVGHDEPGEGRANR